jgi:hypothetical protein
MFTDAGDTSLETSPSRVTTLLAVVLKLTVTAMTGTHSSITGSLFKRLIHNNECAALLTPQDVHPAHMLDAS